MIVDHALPPNGARLPSLLARTMYFGVDDDGAVLGIAMSRAMRDDVRLMVDKTVQTFKPQVDADLWITTVSLSLVCVCVCVCGCAWLLVAVLQTTCLPPLPSLSISSCECQS